jgi:hypothetical protein
MSNEQQQQKMNSLKEKNQIYKLFCQNGYTKSYDEFKKEIENFLNSEETRNLLNGDFSELSDEILEMIAGGIVNPKRVITTSIATLLATCTVGPSAGAINWGWLKEYLPKWVPYNQNSQQNVPNNSPQNVPNNSSHEVSDLSKAKKAINKLENFLKNSPSSRDFSLNLQFVNKCLDICSKLGNTIQNEKTASKFMTNFATNIEEAINNQKQLYQIELLFDNLDEFIRMTKLIDSVKNFMQTEAKKNNVDIKDQLKKFEQTAEDLYYNPHIFLSNFEILINQVIDSANNDSFNIPNDNSYIEAMETIFSHIADFNKVNSLLNKANIVAFKKPKSNHSFFSNLYALEYNIIKSGKYKGSDWADFLSKYEKAIETAINKENMEYATHLFAAIIQSENAIDLTYKLTPWIPKNESEDIKSLIDSLRNAIYENTIRGDVDSIEDFLSKYQSPVNEAVNSRNSEKIKSLINEMNTHQTIANKKINNEVKNNYNGFEIINSEDMEKQMDEEDENVDSKNLKSFNLEVEQNQENMKENASNVSLNEEELQELKELEDQIDEEDENVDNEELKFLNSETEKNQENIEKEKEKFKKLQKEANKFSNLLNQYNNEQLSKKDLKDLTNEQKNNASKSTKKQRKNMKIIKNVKNKNVSEEEKKIMRLNTIVKLIGLKQNKLMTISAAIKQKQHEILRLRASAQKTNSQINTTKDTTSVAGLNNNKNDAKDKVKKLNDEIKNLKQESTTLMQEISNLQNSLKQIK